MKMVNYSTTPRKRNRLENYDYSQDGWYFVTVCTKEKEEFFGEIKNNKIILNTYGKIVENQWLWLKEQYYYVQLNEYVIMPNHTHAIIIIGNSNICRDNNICRDRSRPVPTVKIKSLSELIGAFKTTSSKMIHQNGLEHFVWQRSFYDRIIRDEKALHHIRKYIKDNPLRWQFDNNNQVSTGRDLSLQRNFQMISYECIKKSI